MMSMIAVGYMKCRLVFRIISLRILRNSLMKIIPMAEIALEMITREISDFLSGLLGNDVFGGLAEFGALFLHLFEVAERVRIHGRRTQRDAIRGAGTLVLGGVPVSLRLQLITEVIDEVDVDEPVQELHAFLGVVLKEMRSVKNEFQSPANKIRSADTVFDAGENSGNGKKKLILNEEHDVLNAILCR